MRALTRPSVALDARSGDRFGDLAGQVGISVPVSWTTVSYGLILTSAVAFAFLFLASYSRIVTVPGIILPDKCVAAIIPYQPGVLSKLAVADGDSVAKGAQIAEVRVDRDLDATSSTASLTASAIDRQDRSLSSQLTETAGASQAEIGEVRARRAAAAAILVKLRAQMALQRDLVATAEQDLANATEVAERGFISRQDVQNRQERFLSRQQQLFQLEQSVATQQSALAEADRSIAQIASRAATGPMRYGRPSPGWCRRSSSASARPSPRSRP